MRAGRRASAPQRAGPAGVWHPAALGGAACAHTTPLPSTVPPALPPSPDCWWKEQGLRGGFGLRRRSWGCNWLDGSWGCNWLDGSWSGSWLDSSWRLRRWCHRRLRVGRRRVATCCRRLLLAAACWRRLCCCWRRLCRCDLGALEERHQDRRPFLQHRSSGTSRAAADGRRSTSMAAAAALALPASAPAAMPPRLPPWQQHCRQTGARGPQGGWSRRLPLPHNYRSLLHSKLQQRRRSLQTGSGGQSVSQGLPGRHKGRGKPGGALTARPKYK